MIIKLKLLSLLLRIPSGNVAYYGQIASALSFFYGKNISGLLIGRILSGMNQEEQKQYPRWRVVAKNGKIVSLKLGDRGMKQIQLLQSEGVTISNNYLDIHKYCVDNDLFYCEKEL